MDAERVSARFCSAGGGHCPGTGEVGDWGTAALVDGVVEAIAKAARTDKIGDGKVFVLDVESALRIRTGETDAAAL